MDQENAFDIAAQKAKEELDEKLKTLTPEQLAGVKILAGWWSKNFMNAGHKRLGRIVAGLR